MLSLKIEPHNQLNESIHNPSRSGIGLYDHVIFYSTVSLTSCNDFNLCCHFNQWACRPMKYLFFSVVIGAIFTGCASDGSFDPKTFQQVVGAATTTYTNYENERQKQAEAQLP